jgi:sporulation protein YlmC with PRC-barrel domain
MLTKHLLAGLAAAALIAAPALAQSTAPATPTPPAASTAPAAGPSASGAAMSGQFLPMRQPEQFRASDFIGARVYGANDENIGEINDVLMDAKGQVAGVIIGVGGFLGIGEKDVALPMSALQFRNDPPATATTSRDTATTGTVSTPTPPAGAPAGATAAAQDDDGVPNRIIVSMTKDQLQQAPTFRNNPNEAADTTQTSPSASTTAPPATPNAPRQ